MSWNELGSIWRDNQAQQESDAELPPEECPYDGAPLVVGRNGERRCPMGDYRWRP